LGKTTNKELAKEISERIQELLDETDLRLEGLAVLSTVGKSAIRSYFSKTIPISLENIAKICLPFSLKISVFLDFETPLPAHLKEQPRFKKFYNKYIKNNPEYFVVPPDPGNIRPYLKSGKDFLNSILRDSDYLESPKLVHEIAKKIKEDHNVDIESGRLYQQLNSNADVERLPSTKLNKDGSKSKKEVFKYVKKKKSE